MHVNDGRDGDGNPDASVDDTISVTITVTNQSGLSPRVRGSPTTDTAPDPDPEIVGVYDSGGSQVVPGYDDGGEGLNSRTIINPDSTGAYFIAARSAYWWHTGTYNAPPRSEVDCREWIFPRLVCALVCYVGAQVSHNHAKTCGEFRLHILDELGLVRGRKSHLLWVL